MTQINKMAFSIGNDDIDLYLTAMKASEILQVATVSRVDEDAQKGYQRHLSEPRAKLIAYFGESDRSFRFYPITFSSSFSSLPVLP